MYTKDCAPACLKIVAKHYRKDIGIDYLRELCETTRIGTNLENLSQAAEKIGFRTLGVKISLDQIDTAPLPCILHWGKDHFVVLYKIKKNKYFISDPSIGLMNYNLREFIDNWIGKQTDLKTNKGIALLLEITPRFNNENLQNDSSRLPFSYFFAFLKNHKSFVRQLLIGLFLSSFVQFLFPFLTQSIIDVGIVNQDIDFIYLVLFAQLFLYIGKLSISMLRDWILLHIGTRIKVTLISNFIIKLMELPISFFDSKLTGDILQRMEDHEKIRVLLTSSSLNLVFSLFNLVVFGIIIALYNTSIFLVFLIGTVCCFLWFALFLKKRAQVDTALFKESTNDNYKVLELINGMQEIKLNNAERRKRWNWEAIQVKLYNLDLWSLSINQYQTHGTDFINEVTNIIITIMAANLVIQGTITLGMLLAIMYILGQLNLPIRLLLQFIRELQDANLSYQRLSEITVKETDEITDKINVEDIKNKGSIHINDLNFRYSGIDKLCLKNISFDIPHHKVTALVGKSGSGKTTLLKLLLKFYQPISGTIKIGNINLKKISNNSWRNYCGVVMQEGFIFDDSLRNNICLSDSFFDKKRFNTAVEIANLTQLIDELPKGYNTPIGNKGIGLSTGEKQRILIARAIYKNSKLLLFDEATSALDTENEKIIINNLDRYYNTRTSLIIAHRLSTVKNADQIIVLDKGEIVEKGTHDKLIERKGVYFNLVRNQLELGI